jgi:hypothetical protein
MELSWLAKRLYQAKLEDKSILSKLIGARHPQSLLLSNVHTGPIATLHTFGCIQGW